MALSAGYLVLSAVYVGLIIVRPGVSHARRVVAMVTDMTMISAAMYWGRESATLLYPIYLWVTFGNGFRYGNRYLALSAARERAGLPSPHLHALSGGPSPTWPMACWPA